MEKVDLSSMTFEQLQDWMVQQGRQAFRGRQVFRWLHARAAGTFEEMTDLSREFRAHLAETVSLPPVEIEEERSAEDGTIKFRYRLRDDNRVEGVFIPEKMRRTLCVSTQVGCGMGCGFCATATMGLVRNLAASEIVGQVEAAMRRLRSANWKRQVTNVVFMGMGEPLANLDGVVAAVEILLHPLGLGLSRRHLTVSTVGLPGAMEEFVRRVPAKLAVSLNATTDEVRSRIMPINKRFPLADLLACCRNLPLQHADRITFEYVLLGGVNDTIQDARRLVGLLAGIRSKVNVIPYNPYQGLPFERPSGERVEAFYNCLLSGRVSAFIRRSRGESLQAACGQLIAKREAC